MIGVLLVFVGVLLNTSAWAHKPSDSYLSLTIQPQQIEGRWDIALRDLEDAIGLDADNDGAIIWSEVRAKHQEIGEYALSHLSLEAGETRCFSQVREHLIEQHTDGAYAVLRFTATCATDITRLAIDYRLLFDIDAQHKGLLRLTQGTETTTAIFSRDARRHQFTMGAGSIWTQIRQYLGEGIWHIWLGYDHLLFLLTLLLPAVLVRNHDRWEAVAGFSSVLWEVVTIVTAFTVAHSLTLTLATLKLIQLPSRLVESAIAVSVLLAGLANLYPTLARRRWLVAFSFGLIHGFGFAGVLADLGLPQGSLLTSLVSFNVGVEIGQLGVVALFLPVAFLIRESWSYQSVIVRGGSIAVMLLALIWFMERAFNLKLLPA